MGPGIGAAAVALLLASGGHATASLNPGMWADLRLSMVLPFGTLSDDPGDQLVQHKYSSLVPGQFDLGWRLKNGLELGGFVSWAYAGAADDCSDCTGSQVRYGVEATWHFAPHWASLLPWFGIGFGPESLHLDSSTTESTYRGWAASLQAGADWRLGKCVDVGPVLSFGAGIFKHLEVTSVPHSGSEDLRYQTAHYALGLGVRAAFAMNCTYSAPGDPR